MHGALALADFLNLAGRCATKDDARTLEQKVAKKVLWGVVASMACPHSPLVYHSCWGVPVLPNDGHFVPRHRRSAGHVAILGKLR